MTDWILVGIATVLIAWELWSRFGHLLKKQVISEPSTRDARVEAVESLETVLQLCVEQKWETAAEHTRAAARALYEDSAK